MIRHGWPTKTFSLAQRKAHCPIIDYYRPHSSHSDTVR